MPTGDAFADENGILTESYKMFVNIIKNNKIKKTYDLSEENIKLNRWDYQDKLEVHEKGPCHKVLDFVDKLLSEQI